MNRKVVNQVSLPVFDIKLYSIYDVDIRGSNAIINERKKNMMK